MEEKNSMCSNWQGEEGIDLQDEIRCIEKEEKARV